MRILLVLHTYPPESWGGTELHVQGIAAHLKAIGHEVMVFCRYGDSNDPEGTLRDEQVGGLRVVRFNNTFANAKGFESTYLDAEAHQAFEGILDGFQPDVVHVHHLIGLSTTILAACKKGGVPLVYSLHDFWVACPRGQRLTPELHLCETIDRNKCFTCLRGLWPDWFSNRMTAPNIEIEPGRLSPEVLVNYDSHMAQALEMPDLLLTPSEFHRRKMIELGLDGDRIVALAHGLDHSRIPPRVTGDDVKVIGYIGSVIPTKGVHVLLEAFSILDREDVELHVWGEAPDYHEHRNYANDLKALALGSRGKVCIYGGYDHEEVGTILGTLDILVVPSVWWETFSLTIREGMLAGIPIVASDIGAMREALDNHKAGLLFETGNATDLADSLSTLILNPALRKGFSQARDTVKTVEQNAEEYVGLYDKARKLAEKREAALVIPETEIAETEPASLPATTNPAQPPAVSRSSMDLGDVFFELKQVGGGPVSLSSAVDRTDGTSVCFQISQGDSELQLTVRIPEDDQAPATSTPPNPDSGDGSEIPSDPESTQDDELDIDPGTVNRSTDGMLLGQSAAHHEKEQTKAMFSLNPEVFGQHVSALDEMIEGTHLETKSDDQPRKPRRRRNRTKASHEATSVTEVKVIDVEATPSAQPEPEPEDGIIFGATSWSIPEATGDRPSSKNKGSKQKTNKDARDAGSFGDGIE